MLSEDIFSEHLEFEVDLILTINCDVVFNSLLCVALFRNMTHL